MHAEEQWNRYVRRGQREMVDDVALLQPAGSLASPTPAVLCGVKLAGPNVPCPKDCPAWGTVRS